MDPAHIPSGSADRPRHIQILDEAARIFNQRGVSSKPLSDLAERLELSRAALYYYVKDREDLVFQVYRRTCEILDHCLSEAQAGESDAIAVVQRFVALALDPESPDLSALSELGLLRPDDGDAIREHYERIVTRLGDILKAGQAAGQVRRCDAFIAARTIVSIVISIPTNSGWVESAKGPDQADRRLQIGLAQDMLADGWLSDRSLVIDPPPIDLEPVALAKVAAFDRKGMMEARREAILAAASRLFNRKGIDSTSLDEIAAAVGSTKRTLYQLVGDKVAMAVNCARRSGRIMEYIFAQASENYSEVTMDPGLLIRWQRAIATAQLRKDIEPLRVVTGIGAQEGSYTDEIIQMIRSEEQKRLQLVSGFQKAGLMRRFDQERSRWPQILWWNSMSWLSRGLIEADDFQRPLIAAEVVEVLSLGLRAI